MSRIADTIDHKERIMNEHQDKLLKNNKELVELAIKAIRDSKVNADAKLSFGNLIKIGGKAGSTSSTGMSSDAKLEVFESVLQNAKETRTLITGDYTSLVKDLDYLIDSYHKELNGIDEELKLADKEEKKRLEQEKSKVLTRGSTD